MDYRLLGSLEVRRGDGPLPLGGPKQRALLAILLLNANRVVSRDRLIDELWGELPPPSAGHMLDVTVSRLRKVLGAGGDMPLKTAAPGYVLRVGAGELDAERFECLLAEGRAAVRRGAAGEGAAT